MSVRFFCDICGQEMMPTEAINPRHTSNAIASRYGNGKIIKVQGVVNLQYFFEDATAKESPLLCESCLRSFRMDFAKLYIRGDGR